MRIFCNFMRHMQLINWWIVVYAIKEHVCLLKGDTLEPSVNAEQFLKFLQEIKKGGELPVQLPMGAYEYDCCVEYLLKLRRMLVASRRDFQFLKFEFDLVALEDCLEKVCKECGFALVSEKSDKNKYVYTIKSKFWEE